MAAASNLLPGWCANITSLSVCPSIPGTSESESTYLLGSGKVQGRFREGSGKGTSESESTYLGPKGARRHQSNSPRAEVQVPAVISASSPTSPRCYVTPRSRRSNLGDLISEI